MLDGSRLKSQIYYLGLLAICDSNQKLNLV